MNFHEFCTIHYWILDKFVTVCYIWYEESLKILEHLSWTIQELIFQEHFKNCLICTSEPFHELNLLLDFMQKGHLISVP